MINKRWRELRYREKFLCLFRSGVALRRACKISDFRRLSIQFAQSDTMQSFEVQLKRESSRTLVDWEEIRHFLMPFSCSFRSRSRFFSSCWYFFRLPSFEILPPAFFIQTVLVLVATFFRIWYQTFSSDLHASLIWYRDRNLEHFRYPTPFSRGFCTNWATEDFVG